MEFNLSLQLRDVEVLEEQHWFCLLMCLGQIGRYLTPESRRLGLGARKLLIESEHSIEVVVQPAPDGVHPEHCKEGDYNEQHAYLPLMNRVTPSPKATFRI